MNTTSKKVIIGVFIATLILMLWNYSQGYENSISWSVTTTADLIEFPAWTMNNGLMEHQVMSEKYVLQESYSGSRIERNLLADQIYLGICWVGVCIFLALSTSFSRYFFFTIMASLALFINRLNLFEVGLFGIESKMVMTIPFVALLLPLVYFHEYRKKAPFLIRLMTLVIISSILCLGVQDGFAFTDHFITHSLFGFAVLTLLFIFLISEELVFLFLYAVSSTKGGKSNHLHFIFISLIYLSNLTLYYLNKSGIYENSFFFFDPFILLVISTLVALWSIKFKDQIASNFIPLGSLPIILASLGIIAFSYLSLSMQRGVETVHQSFHYFVVYSHLAFGALFFLYIISNFIDPLVKGLEVHKIAYRERNFPYLTARLGGFVAILAFFFLSGQEAYTLLRSGYYSYLSMKEKNLGNELLSKEYLINSEFLGFNAHFPNYNLAWEEWDKGNEFRAKSNFFNATQRYPSPYAWVNYGNLEAEENPNKVQAVYEESLRRLESPEMENNLGIIHLKKNEPSKALDYFIKIAASEDWNDAPTLNKWNTLHVLGAIDTLNLQQDFAKGNYGVKANILASNQNTHELNFQFNKLGSSPILHRHAYLLNSTHKFDHDSIESHIRKEIAQSLSGSANTILANALAIHLYKKGEVNKSFKLLDELQANTNELYKGKYLDALGKFALDQGAYQLAVDFFSKALKSGYQASRISRLEAFAAQGKNDIIANELLKILKQDPGLTLEANNLLASIETYVPKKRLENKISVDSLESTQIIALANRNAFDEPLIMNAVEELNKRDSVMSSYEILVNAIEINPYSVPLLKSYILSATEWNLNDYANQSMERLKELITEGKFKEFEEIVVARKEELESEEW